MGPIEREEKLEYCQIHMDAIFPMIKILIAPIVMSKGKNKFEDNIRCFSIVKKENRYIPVYEYWNCSVTIQIALDHMRKTCKMVLDSYIVTEKDFTLDEIRERKTG